MSAHHAALRAGSMKPAILTARRERPSRRPVVREPGRAGAQRPVELGHRLSRLPLSQGRGPVHLALRPALPVDVDRLLAALDPPVPLQAVEDRVERAALHAGRPDETEAVLLPGRLLEERLEDLRLRHAESHSYVGVYIGSVPRAPGYIGEEARSSIER